MSQVINNNLKTSSPDFIIYETAIPCTTLTRRLNSSSAAGAVVIFEGRVRNTNDNQTVVALEYETNSTLCQQEAEKILTSVRQRFDLLEVACGQRIGRISVGGLAVWIGVTAQHRQQAFDAAQEIITAFKHQLPIWKKEYYADGSFGWLAGTPLEQFKMAVEPQAIENELGPLPEYYIRQAGMFSQEISAQKSLSAATVLVIGAGGLGSTTLTSLTQIGVGTLGICENDILEVSNLHRQSLYRYDDIGRPKIDLAAKRLTEINPTVKLHLYRNRLCSETTENVIKDYDLILDCTDNLSSKFLINDGCVRLKKPLIQASIFQLQGEIRRYVPGSKTACLRCIWPLGPTDNKRATTTSSWVIGITPAVVGHLQALEAVKFLLRDPRVVMEEVLMVDLDSFQFHRVKMERHIDCPLCHDIL